MKATTRRVVQAVLYELIAVCTVGPALSLIFDAPVGSSVALAVLMSSVALAWNFVFNAWFEGWEARQVEKGRSWGRRLLHGLGFEGGLVLVLVPVMAWWLNTSLVKAFLADLGVLAFFFVYAIAFTWAFDRVFGLPQSATNPCEACPLGRGEAQQQSTLAARGPGLSSVSRPRRSTSVVPHRER